MAFNSLQRGLSYFGISQPVPYLNQLSGHHSLGNSTKVGIRVGVSITACKYAVSASRRNALNPFSVATPILARAAAKNVGALLVSANRSAAEVPVFVQVLDP